MLYLQYWHHLTGVCNAADEFFLGSENTWTEMQKHSKDICISGQSLLEPQTVFRIFFGHALLMSHDREYQTEAAHQVELCV
jgi:hypothetical protein